MRGPVAGVFRVHAIPDFPKVAWVFSIAGIIVLASRAGIAAGHARRHLSFQRPYFAAHPADSDRPSIVAAGNAARVGATDSFRVPLAVRLERIFGADPFSRGRLALAPCGLWHWPLLYNGSSC